MKIMLLLLLIVGVSHADLVASREHSFIVIMPAKHEKFAMENALGPMTAFMSVDQQNQQIFQVMAHRIVSYKDSKGRSIDQTKELVLGNFSAYCTEGKALGLTTLNIEKKWATGYAWPVLKYSFERQGYLENRKPLYLAGVEMLIDDTFFRLTVQSESKTGLDKAVTKFFGTFCIADEAAIRLAEEAGAGQSATRPESDPEGSDKP